MINSIKRIRLIAILSCLVLIVACSTSAEDTYDLVILNGRVMDPETGFDAVRNVGIKDGRIATITGEAISGADVIDATDHVVAPGFINTHSHTFAPFDQRLMARDGTTTILDTEMGAADMGLFYDKYAGRSLLNYGVSVGHEPIRINVLDGVGLEHVSDPTSAAQARSMSVADDDRNNWALDIPSEDQWADMEILFRKGLDAGGLGISSTLEYMAFGVTTNEVFNLQKIVAKYDRVYGIHTRFGVTETLPKDFSLGSREAIANFVALDGGGLILSHIQGAPTWREVYELYTNLFEKDYAILAEYYPSGTGNPNIATPQFQEGVIGVNNAFDIETMIVNPTTGEYYKEDEFFKVQKESPSTLVFVEVVPLDTRKEWAFMKNVALANDMLATHDANGELVPVDMPFEDYVGHPRNSATYSTVFRLAREQGIPLMDIVTNASYAPARFFSQLGLASMQERGRLQEGMVADITIFDPEAITENSSMKLGEQGLPSTGIPYVLVSGVPVVRNSVVDLSVSLGKPIRY